MSEFIVTHSQKLNNILSKLKDPKPDGKGGVWAFCPCHPDGQKQGRRSLHVCEKNGRLLFYCFAGCDYREIIAALGLQQTKNSRKRGEKPEAIYKYPDETGSLLYEVIRYPDKRFLQRQPDGVGGYIYNLKNVRRVLYRLPEVLAAIQEGRTIFLVEGEKDADNVAALGLPATTNPGGAGKWHDAYCDSLKGGNIVILPDNDMAGRQHAEKVAQSLKGKAKSVKVLELPGLPEKGDVSDWLSAGGVKEELLKLAAAAPEWEPARRTEIAASTIENLTDLGNSRRFVRQAAGNVRYLTDSGKWITWTGKKWEVDKSGEVMRKARQAVRSMYAEAATVLDENERKALARHAIKSESESRLRAMVNLAASEPEIPIAINELDRDPYLLNCLNGTIDLKTGELRPHRREDFITKICPVEYDPDARSELFDAFLERILPDVEVRRYTQKALGYSITGDTSLEKLFFAYGPPATGKSTLLSAVESVLGDYAATADFESFLHRDRATGAARNDIARLAGRRFVLSVEVDDGRKLAESLVNQLTGGDTVSARFLYKESFEFRPEFKLWLAANNRPRVSGPESAIWRRLVQLPFMEAILEKERDPQIKTRLRGTERPAVLAWLVEGCLLWQKEGLEEPEAIKQLTEDYREESDPLKDFLSECCTLNPTAQAKNSDLWGAYQAWAKESGERFPLGRKKFTQALRNRGLDQYNTGSERVWIGIGVTTESY